MDAVMQGASSINMTAVLIANGLGAGLMLLLLLSKRSNGRMVSLDSRLFDGMCRLCMALCLLETVSFWIDGRMFAGARDLNILINALLFTMNSVFAYSFSVYVDYKLFENFDRLRRYYTYGMIPAAVVCLMCVLNLFTKVFFWVTEDNVYYRAPLVLITYLVTYCYLTYGALLVFRHRHKSSKYMFLPVLLFLAPVYLCSLIQLHFYGIAVIWVSVAFGLTSLYINLQNERALLDTLTNLYNRSYLLHYMDYLIRRAHKGTCVIGLMLDVNDFKFINDTYGHLEGDAVLRAVGKILQTVTGGQGAVVRYGGDEFVVLLENARSDSGEQLRERIGEELAKYNASGKAPCRISLSMGVAEFDLVDVDRFFHDMDQKMYEDKRAFYQKEGNDRRRRRRDRDAEKPAQTAETETKI